MISAMEAALEQLRREVLWGNQNWSRLSLVNKTKRATPLQGFHTLPPLLPTSFCSQDFRSLVLQCYPISKEQQHGYRRREGGSIWQI